MKLCSLILVLSTMFASSCRALDLDVATIGAVGDGTTDNSANSITIFDSRATKVR